MNTSVLPQLWQLVGLSGFFSLDKATSLEKEKLWIQTSCTLLKNWPCITFNLWQQSCVNECIHTLIHIQIYIYIYIYIERERERDVSIHIHTLVLKHYPRFYFGYHDMILWHYVGHSLFWCVWVSVRESLCLFSHETHTEGLDARSLARPEVDEGRKVPEKTERVSWQRWPEGDSQGQSRRWEWDRRRTQSTEVSVASGFCGSFVRVHARVSSQNAQKVLRNSPSWT